MAKRGMSSIKEAVKEQKQSGGFTRYFRLGDGETTDIVLLGTRKSEPYHIHKHTFKNGAQFSSIGHREEDCVACYANTMGDKRISRPGIRLAFSLFDLAWMKKKRDEKRSEKEGRDRFDFKRVDADSVTQKGIRKGIFVRSGKCAWEMPPQWAQALFQIDKLNGKRCKSCGKGKIKLLSYFDTKKQKKVTLADKEPDEIDDLIASGRIKEKLECSKCKKPERTGIFNSIVTVTRAGAMTNTTYQFAINLDDYPEDFVELMESKERPEPYDWDAIGEPSTEQQAQMLGIRNPFGSKKSRGKDDDAEDYDDDDAEASDSDDDDEDEETIFNDDDDDDDEDADEDDDSDPLDDEDNETEDEDEEVAARDKKKKKGAKAKHKSVELEDDDDDADEDEPKVKAKKKIKFRR